MIPAYHRAQSHEPAIANSECAFCGGPIPTQRISTEYCSARCWEKHFAAEFDHWDDRDDRHEDTE